MYLLTPAKRLFPYLQTHNVIGTDFLRICLGYVSIRIEAAAQCKDDIFSDDFEISASISPLRFVDYSSL